MSEQRLPTFEQILAAPIDELTAIVPATMALCGAGTRREAVLRGIPLDRDYPGWSMDRLLRLCQRIFAFGVQDLFVSIIRSTQVAEGGDYGRALWSLARAILGDERRLEWIVEAGFQVRCFGAADMPQIADVLAQVERTTAAPGRPTMWWMFATSVDSLWQQALTAICAAGATTRAAAIQAIYGQPVAPMGIYLAFGKPFFSPELMPPLLDDETACFWYQQPGYGPLTDRVLRRIFYDAAYLRHTWTADKSARYAGLEAQRAIWEQPMVLGLGQRVGGFWRPLVDQGTELCE